MRELQALSPEVSAMTHRTEFVLPAHPVLSALAIFCCLACGSGPVRAQSACSTTRYSCPDASGESSELQGSYCNSEVSWDLTTGTFHCEAGGCWGAGNAGGESVLATTALYTVTGLPAGTPVVVRMRFTVNEATTPCEWGCLMDGGDSVSVVGPGAAWSASNFGGTQVIEMQYDGFSGDSFGIACYFDSWAYLGEGCGWIIFDGQIDFYEVTAGASIAPCVNSPTPTRSASWGRLKAMYR